MSSHHTCCTKQKVKRGLWSPEEDEKLIKYVSKYGHGCWSTVPRLAGLQRCGKSCRLRWINYLRPDLKRGNFNTHEANLIIELHRLIGNRWAQIAKHLPGRTDNEVKNFWNSSIKRKLNLELDQDETASSSQSPPPSLSPQNLYLFHPTMNNNLQIPNPQMGHQINPNYHPPQFLGFDLDQMMMNHEPNYALMPPPSIHVPPDSSWINFPPSPTPYLNPDQSFMVGYDISDPNPNPNPNSNPGFFFDQDSAMFDAFMPELNEISCWNDDFGLFSPPEPLFDQTQFSNFSNGVNPPSPPLHPNHIDNIAALMATFAAPPPPPQTASRGPFFANQSFPSTSWAPQQP